MKTTRALSSSIAAAALLAACGGGGSSSTSGNVCTPGTTTSVTITANGPSPKSSCVLPGGTVDFKNTDTSAHSISATTGGASCAPIAVTSIAAGATQTSGTLAAAAACGFAVDGSANAALQGTVFVQSAPAGGPGH